MSRDFTPLGESEWREIYYSHAGGFDQQWVERGAPRWLNAMTGESRALEPFAVDEVGLTAEQLQGRNTYVEVRDELLLM